jgi:hypothetical protein
VRVLLDECLPRGLRRHLAGHDVATVPEAGWSGVRNGELLARAGRRFDAFVTIDQRMERERVVPATLALITIEAPSNRLADIAPLAPAVLRALETVRPGETVRVRIA